MDLFKSVRFRTYRPGRLMKKCFQLIVGLFSLAFLLSMTRIYWKEDEDTIKTLTFDSKEVTFELAFTLDAFRKVSKELPPNINWASLIEEAFAPPIEFDDAVFEHMMKLQTQLWIRYKGIFLNSGVKRVSRPKTGHKINVATIVCGQRRTEALAMFKSAIVFSQDSDLHLIVFSDQEEIVNVAMDLLELRWKANAAGWDFTFELHLDIFPSRGNWKSMYAKCATQRLFFPSRLPHVDSLVYLDSDTVVLSNLTEFYLQFKHMNNSKLMAATANNEPVPNNGGHYRDHIAKVPFWGTHGLNAGILLMNLTLMREFKMQERCIAAQLDYKNEITLADQDIYNIIFHFHPELFHELPCTYNFHYVHCGYPGLKCYDEKGEHTCWCRKLDTTGVHILHGCVGTFHEDKPLAFLPAIYNAFRKLDFTDVSPLQLIRYLEENDVVNPRNSCHRLTTDMMFRNAKAYLSKLYRL